MFWPVEELFDVSRVVRCPVVFKLCQKYAKMICWTETECMFGAIHSSPVISHMQLSSTKGASPIVEQSLGI